MGDTRDSGECSYVVPCGHRMLQVMFHVLNFGFEDRWKAAGYVEYRSELFFSALSSLGLGLIGHERICTP